MNIIFLLGYQFISLTSHFLYINKALGSATIGHTYIEGNQIILPSVTAPSSFKSWAIITPSSSSTIKVEDEAGNVTTQEIITGEDLILGRNVTGNANDIVKLPKLTLTHDIYDRW